MSFAILLVVAIDFSVLSYLRLIDAADEGATVHSDAIVVFSGDPSRIARGFKLLAQGDAPLLFIAGLDNQTDILEAKKNMPAFSKCCVETDPSTRNTHEDAQAIAKWTKSRGLRSLIVVTTNIHMPRAVAELNGLLPKVNLDPIGVAQGLYDSRDWRRNRDGWPRLTKELCKYTIVRLNNAASYFGIDAIGYLGLPI